MDKVSDNNGATIDATDIKTLRIEIQRYLPDSDDEPRYEHFDIPYDENWSLLDALQHIKEDVDPTLSYRWSCRMAVCGSCGMVINGKEKLACETFIRDYYPGKMRLQPLNNFTIERDLVVDQEDFLAKLEAVKPYIIDAAAATKPPKPKKQQQIAANGEYKQLPKQVAMFSQYSDCINCLLCYSACPQFGLNPDFVGPSAIALAHRYNVDSRDYGSDQRLETLNSKDGVWSCTFVGYCSEVCPKSVDPASAIQQQKISGLTDWALSKLPGGS
ncbi:Fumarate reductase iron-sulfur subunit [Sinobacterium norvegicum]|uniref:Succinate dehydrogenase iron-sulfur subunit n=1 Tax=Sinobacterium norvegicum TaxID=1641715 RepID=A0ABM9AHR4_9GAMM|nr:succinate dehydrogenase/fumarate reductase iron-sulfur subunit [Sinobacterium norvegicum]CAH0992549.1 Fumarate reductase iron-sulfur subunit [Sinobacterium norvegicum]